MKECEEYYWHDWEKKKDDVELRIEFPKSVKVLTEALENQIGGAKVKPGYLSDSIPNDLLL